MVGKRVKRGRRSERDTRTSTLQRSRNRRERPPWDPTYFLSIRLGLHARWRAARLRHSDEVTTTGDHPGPRCRCSVGMARYGRAMASRSAWSRHLGRGALHRRRLLARVLLVPAGVAVGERGGGDAVGEDGEADGQVDREHDQVLVRQLGLLDHDHREDDRRQPAGAEPAEEPERRRRAREPHIAITTGSIRTRVRLRSA